MLKANNITIKFGGLTAVNNVNLSIEKGLICGLIGPNGAGKTTFFNIISGVYKPTSGSVTYKDKDITGMFPHKINEVGISRTYQSINLFHTMSVADNVMVGMHTRLKSNLICSAFHLKSQKQEEIEARKKVDKLLDFIGILDKRDKIAGSLSYGEQRLVEITRAIASEPQLLLLDEPAAGMNTKEKQDLSEIIQRIRDTGITILLVEHDMKLVMGITDYIYVLNYGQKIAQGDPIAVKNNPEVIKAYLGGEIYGNDSGN